MPRRDAQDGGHTAFTDHRIQRRPVVQSDSPPPGDIAAWREPSPDLRTRNLGIAYVSAGLQRRSTHFLVQGYQLLTQVQQQFSSDPEIFTSMGTALLIGKQPSEAEFAFERALELKPNSAVAETNVAAAHQQAGDINGTIAHLERAVAIDPVHLPAASALINLYQQQGNPAKANELAEKVRAIMHQRPGEGHPVPSQVVSASSPPKMADAVFKNLKVLNGIPSDQLIPSMRFISSSLGVECGFCHIEGHFDDDSKKEKQTARSMMRMMLSINQNHFDGTREVTCYSCHRGTPRPVAIPVVVRENQPLAETEADRDRPTELPTADQIIDNYVRALGGADLLEKITTRVETGSMASEGKSFEVEFFDKDPDKELFVQHTPAGDSVTALDGNSGWANAPGRPMRDLSGSDLDAARADADLQFPLHIKQMFPELRVEYPEQVDGRETYVVVGSREAGPSWKFYFDAASALLVRVVRFAESPLGLDPTQIDYKDFRAIDGVQTPSTWTISRAGSRSTIHMSEIHDNIPIDDEKFRKRAQSEEASTPH